MFYGFIKSHKYLSNEFKHRKRKIYYDDIVFLFVLKTLNLHFVCIIFYSQVLFYTQCKHLDFYN